MLHQCIIYLAIIVISCEAAYLPTYIDKCSLRDPDLNACITKNANKAIPKIVKGDVHYDIPILSPLYIPHPIDLKYDRELRLTLSNGVVYGLENTRSLKTNFSIDTSGTVLYNPRITVLANYEINGQLLHTPIYGAGIVNITLENGEYDFSAQVTYNIIDGESYISAHDPKLDYKTERSYYYFHNLYDGNIYLGEQMNRYLNQNWRAVQKTLRPAAKMLISSIITTVNNGIISNVPQSEIFKP